MPEKNSTTGTSAMNSQQTVNAENSVCDVQKSPETETCPDRKVDTDNYVADADKEEIGPRPEEKHLIQIVASNEEINRRIAALIEQKQREVDENNCQEFCGVHPGFQDLENQCARTASVFVPRAGGKSHIKENLDGVLTTRMPVLKVFDPLPAEVSRVVNMYGPQTRALSHAVSERPPVLGEHKHGIDMMEGIEERLANMETHLKIAGSSKSDVYSRLKNLEERILFLESLSPEYFTSGLPQPKRTRYDSTAIATSNIDEDLSLSEIDIRIKALRESLLLR